MKQEIESLKQKNTKLWSLVKELEKENGLYITASKNYLTEISELKKDIFLEKDLIIKNLNEKIKKLESDNSFLKVMILKRHPISIEQLNSILGNLKYRKNQIKNIINKNK
jgi:hypothetical protein